jgi:2-oxoglutarate dehydrogenase E1 component
MRFARDVFIDLLGYRKYGHNEGDAVLHNQYCIKLLQNIKPRDLYADKLMADGIIDATYVKS